MAGIKQFDETRFLEDALAMFWQQGVVATSMLDLAASTGIQRGSLYNAFGDKEAIFVRAYDLYAEQFLQSVRFCFVGNSAEKMLTAFFRKVISSMRLGTPPRGCLTTKTIGDGSIDSAIVHARVRQLLSDLTEMIERALETVQDQLTLTPAQAARLIVTYSRGLAIMERVHGDHKVLIKEAATLQALMLASRDAVD